MTFVATGKNVTDKPIAFRPTPEHAELIAELRATFGPRDGASRCYAGASAGEAFRWLLDQPAVRSVIDERVAAQTHQGDGEHDHA